MLDSTIGMSYTTDGTSGPVTVAYTKRAHEVNSAMYRKDAVIADPGLPDHKIQLSTVEAKATGTFYGTRRATWNVRHEAVIPVPGGTAKFPIIFKGECSVPVGVTANEIESEVACFRAFVNHDIFKRLTKSLET